MALPIRVLDPARPVFVTLVTASRAPWLSENTTKFTVLDAMQCVTEAMRFRRYGYAILNDHLHWIVHPNTEAPISRIIAGLKRNISLRLRGRMSECRWQDRFFDHVIRDPNDFRRHLDYIHYNPVKHGYVRIASDYRWSSLKEWERRGVYPPMWGIGQVPRDLHSMQLE